MNTLRIYDNNPPQVGRVLHQGDVIPGKVVPSHGCCYIPWGGQEHGLRNFQVLHTRPGVEMVWIPTSGREIPTGAIQGGATADGEPLFIGRHEHEGSYVVGKIQPSHEVLYVAFGGQEVPYRDYEILCLKHLPL